MSLWMADFASIRDLNQVLLQRLESRAAEINGREAELRHDLEQCDLQRRDLERERQVLLEAERIYAREIDAGLETRQLFCFEALPSVQHIEPVAPPIEAPKQLKARIGPQRYRMLHALRQIKPTAFLVQDIANRTGLSFRRVKDQMLADQDLGVVAAESFDANAYKITNLGLDLLERFENYKKTRGEPLPSLTEPIAEDDGEEETEALDHQTEGGITVDDD